MGIFFILAVALMFEANSPRDNIEHTKDSLEVIKKNVAEGKAVLVDVRSEEEWKEGHLEGSLFVPVTSLRKGGDPKELAKVLPEKKILYTFCVVGMRAKQAGLILENQGYTVRALKPGFRGRMGATFRFVAPTLTVVGGTGT